MTVAHTPYDPGAQRLSPTDVVRQRRHSRLAPWRWPLAVLAIGALSGLGWIVKPAAPKVDASGLFVDAVRRGEMVREVHAPGRLVPEEVRWLTAMSSARVEQVLLRPGARVEPETVVVELSNPDLELQLLEAQRQLAGARADLATLQANAQSSRLAQESVVASLRADLADARRREEADAQLAKRGFLSGLEMAQSQERARSLSGKLSFEEKRMDAQVHGSAAQAAAQRAQVQRQESLVEFRRAAYERLRVRAGMTGVLQELTLEPGQSVVPGALLAKVAGPERLKAEVRVPEIDAKDIVVGQAAKVDVRSGVVKGRVVHVEPAVQAGTVRVDLGLEGELPAGARADLTIEATIEIERLADVLYVTRPPGAQRNRELPLFRLTPDGTEARRTRVRIGRMSARLSEIAEGLAPGDRIVLSDTSAWDAWDRVRLR